MLRILEISGVTFAFLMWRICSAQVVSYADADNLGQALSMMKTSLTVATSMRARCAASVPSLAPEIDENLSIWRTRESDVIGKTERAIRLIAAERPDDVRKANELIIRGLTNQLAVAEKQGTLPALCRRHFSELASGVWRQRTPRLYKFIEEATLR